MPFFHGTFVELVPSILAMVRKLDVSTNLVPRDHQAYWREAKSLSLALEHLLTFLLLLFNNNIVISTNTSMAIVTGIGRLENLKRLRGMTPLTKGTFQFQMWLRG